jgi:superfamily II DNA or RNA helicase
LIFVENYKNIIKEIIEDDEKISDYYTSKKHISKLKKYYNKNIFNINENKEIELTNYQHSSINYLSDNRDKNIVILLPTGF